MKKIITILFLSFLISGTCYSQSGWFWQNPYPTGNDLECVRFYNENVGYAVGWNGTVIKTTNAGNNWFLANNGVLQLIGEGYYSGVLRYVQIFDSSKIIAAGNGFIKTTNGGLNWQLINPSYTEIFVFTNETTGYFLNSSYNDIYKTVNGGFNWSSVYHSSYGALALCFVNENTGFSSNAMGNILKTTNAGQNWDEISFGNTNYIRAFFFVNENTGLCVTDHNRIYKTTNAGINWILKYTGNNKTINEFSFSNPDTGYYCNWGDNIFRTYNSGESWDSLLVEGLKMSISSPRNNICFAVGLGGLIYKTSNSGNNWLCKSSEFGSLGDLYSVFFPSETFGYICGEGGAILKTSNSGVNWVKLNSITEKDLYSIYFINNTTGFAAGQTRTFISTTDGGDSWDSVSTIPLTINNIGGLHFLNANTGFFCTSSYLYKTTNHGLTWYPVIFESEHFPSMVVQFLNNQIGFCLANAIEWMYSNVNTYKTFNAGENWTLVSSKYGYSFDNFQMVDENTGYSVTSRQVYKTTNGGVNWDRVFLSDYYFRNCVYFVNENTGYVAGFKTTNAGLNWFSQYIDFDLGQLYELRSIKFINVNTGFIVGGPGGTIFKTTDGGGPPVSISKIPLSFPNIYSLSQNYPNPFNPVTRIKYDVPKSSLVKIIIYDVLGREIETLVNQTQKPGGYEVTWDGSRYASGVYFYKLVTDEWTETRKMVLIK